MFSFGVKNTNISIFEFLRSENGSLDRRFACGDRRRDASRVTENGVEVDRGMCHSAVRVFDRRLTFDP
jgi:hypothetical protein